MNSLHDALTEYLAARRALGTQLGWPESSLRKFVDFVESEGAQFLTTELALRWALQSTTVQPATQARRLGIVRGFATWLQATDARTQIPPHRLLPARHRRPVPHIYSNREIVDLMGAAGQLRSASGLRAATFTALIGLLAATGLRPGEALALGVDDVDLVSGVLAVRRSKFDKSRFVPLEQTTRATLTAYAQFRDSIRPCREATTFLVTGRGTPVGTWAARRTFAQLCQAVGLRTRRPNGGIGPGPRLQDLRHTFATRRLIEWYRMGLDVYRLMPRLATYLGHSSTAHTYWYIQAVPDLLLLATERMEAVARGDVQ
jgi:integrase